MYVFKEYPKWLDIDGGITVKNKAEEEEALRKAGKIPKSDPPKTTTTATPATVSTNPSDKVKIVRRWS